MLTQQKQLERYFSSPFTSCRRRVSTTIYSLKFSHKCKLSTKPPFLKNKREKEETVKKGSPGLFPRETLMTLIHSASIYKDVLWAGRGWRH